MMHTHTYTVGNILYGCGGGIGLADNMLLGILDLHEVNESISHMRLDANHIRSVRMYMYVCNVVLLNICTPACSCIICTMISVHIDIHLVIYK